MIVAKKGKENINFEWGFSTGLRSLKQNLKRKNHLQIRSASGCGCGPTWARTRDQLIMSPNQALFIIFQKQHEIPLYCLI
jgi:hypothetical protein